jgi:putative peptidoglycan lipid II flippase
MVCLCPVNTAKPATQVKQQSLLRSTGLFSSMTLVSRVLGFVRDMVIARSFGAVAGVDAFFVAFKIPNYMRRLFAEGAFSQAFVPVLSTYQQQSEQEAVRRFISRIAGTLGLILLALTVVAVIATPILIRVFAPGFEVGASRYELASYMLKLTFPYLMLISLTALVGAVLNTYGRFGVPAFTPVLLNLVLILAALYLAPLLAEPVTALAWGVLVAGIAQLAFLLPFLMRLRLFSWPRFAWHDPGVQRVLKLMVPALFGVSVAQLNLLVDTIFASFLPVGSVSWLYYSDRLMEFPLGVFGVAIATVILPHLSRQHATQSHTQYSQGLDWAMRSILLLGMPAAVGLFMLAGPLLATLFGYGNFTDYDVRQARLSLMAFAFGVPMFMLIKALASGFYARQNIKTPVKVGVVAMVSNTLLNLLLIGPLAHAGLALATTLAAFLNGGLLLFLLIRRHIYHWQPGWGKFMLQLMLANSMMSGWLWWASPQLVDWLAMSGWYRVGQLALVIVVAVVVYGVSLLLSGVRWQNFRGNFNK